MSTGSDSGICQPLQGNSDFYGRGIRIGIYLQWISAWINLLVDPDSAQTTYGTNSVFVFAIAVATIIASQNDAAAIELYIMLQFMLGFYVTTLSILGLRLWFMSPDTLMKLLAKISSGGFVTSLQDRQSMGGLQEPVSGEYIQRLLAQSHAISDTRAKFLRGFWRAPSPLPLDILSYFKYPELAWSGVAWRIVTATLVASYNVYYWFSRTDDNAQEPSDAGCDSPYIFFFSELKLKGTIVVLFQFFAVVLAIPIFLMAFVLVMLCRELYTWIQLFIWRDIIFRCWRTPLMFLNWVWDRVEVELEVTLSSLTENSSLSVVRFWGYMLKLQCLGMLVDRFGIFARLGDPKISISDVVKFFILLNTSKAKVEDMEDKQPGGGQRSKVIRPTLKIVCLCWNAFIALVTVLFITSIECTIRWNNIRGVNTIDTTGQLIPFTIGCVSISQAVKKLVLLAGKKAYPDWADVKLKVELVPTGAIFFRIIKENKESDPERGVMINNDAGNRDSLGTISRLRERRQSI